MKYDGLIFDLDGTMWSSAQNCACAIKKMKEKHPEIRTFTIEHTSSTMGFSNRQTQEYYFNEFSEEKAEMLTKEFLADITNEIMENGGMLYPDVVDTLKKLKERYRLFIVSNCGHGFVEAFMRQSGTEDLFEDYEYCSRTGLEKGGNIKLIVERNNLKNAAYVGDTVMDQKGASDAGIDFIYAEYGFGKLEADKRIKCFSQLLELE
jgi:phosphoglycolate phosphatase